MNTEIELAFASVAALTTWLHSQEIDTTAWGQGAAKQVNDLWQELVTGESSLQADPPLRCVQVVEVYVEQGGLLLVETAQHFVDGRVRARKRPPSEKMKPGEAPLAAAQRCLVEELAIDEAQLTLADPRISERTTLAESGSYPGLITAYTFYRVQLQVADLPTVPFQTVNAAHGQGDPVTAHQWAWLPRSDF